MTKILPKSSPKIEKQLLVERENSPLPKPETLQKYNKLIPDAAERILKMVEKQSQHRQEIEKLEITLPSKTQQRGQSFAFTITMTVSILAGFLIYTGHTVGGTILGGSAIVPIVTSFLYHSFKNKK